VIQLLYVLHQKVAITTDIDGDQFEPAITMHHAWFEKLSQEGTDVTWVSASYDGRM
jgi:hypothetical protein